MDQGIWLYSFLCGPKVSLFFVNQHICCRRGASCSRRIRNRRASAASVLRCQFSVLVLVIQVIYHNWLKRTALSPSVHVNYALVWLESIWRQVVFISRTRKHFPLARALPSFGCSQGSLFCLKRFSGIRCFSNNLWIQSQAPFRRFISLCCVLKWKEQVQPGK